MLTSTAWTPRSSAMSGLAGAITVPSTISMKNAPATSSASPRRSPVCFPAAPVTPAVSAPRAGLAPDDRPGRGRAPPRSPVWCGAVDRPAEASRPADAQPDDVGSADGALDGRDVYWFVG